MASVGSVTDPGSRPDPSWTGHLHATLVLGLPLIGAQLAQISITVTNTAMIGRLGAQELAAAVIATQIFYLFWMFGLGFAYAVMPIAASAQGKGDARGVRRSVRMGLWAVSLYALLVMPPLWHTETLLLALDQAPEVAALAGDYMRVLQWSMLPYLATFAFRSYLTALERPNVVLIVTISGALANALFNYMLIFGHFGAPRLGVVGSGIASLGTTTIIAALLIAYTAWKPDLRRYELYVRFWKPDWRAFREILRLGWPISLTLLAEVGLFTAAAVMMGWIGTVELAAHGIAMQLASITFMIPLGLASAATVRVGLAYGRRDAAGVGRAARTVLLVSVLAALGAGLVFWIVPEPLIALYLAESDRNAADVLAYAIPLLAVAAAFQIVDTVQVVASGILRGLKDTRTPMLIAIGSYWLVGLPVAYGLAFPLGWGGIGVWFGLASGLLAAAALMTIRFFRRERLGLILQGS